MGDVTYDGTGDHWAGGCPGCGGGPGWHYVGCPNVKVEPEPEPIPYTFPLGQYTFYPSYKPPEYGWICPKCGGVYAPFMPQCTKCIGEDKYSTDTDTNTQRCQCDPNYGEGCDICCPEGTLKP